MFCPTCQTQNDPMSVHCFQCRTQLIFPEQDRSPEVKALVRKMDYRIYGGIGSAAFFVIGFVVFQSVGTAIIIGFVGGVLGRYIATRKSEDL